MGSDLQCDPAARHGTENSLQCFRIRSHGLFQPYLPRFIQHAVPAVAISKIQTDGQCGLRNIPALLRRCDASLLHCRSPLSLVPQSTSITWERTPHPVRRPAFSSHLLTILNSCE